MSSAFSDASVEALEDLVVAAMDRFHVPGVAVGVLNGDEETVRGFGITNLDNPIKVDGDTLFQIGSTTKTVTGLMAMRLVEQGLIELDEPVRTYLPELRLSDAGVTANLTLRHLLTHTGGFEGDYFCDFGTGDDALERAVASMGALAQMAPLGEIWSYCNAGFYIAGRLIEVITGKPYETAARELALDPIGLDRSFFFPEQVMTFRFASGHTGLDEVHVARPWALPRDIHPVGGIISSARDNLKYARFWLADAVTQAGERLLSTDTVRLMQTPLVPTSKREWIGLTWMNREASGVKLIRHGGGTNGQTSAFMFVPSKNFALTVLSNSSRPEMTKAVTEWALKEYLDLEEPKPVPQRSDPNDLARLAGVYQDIASTLELSVVDGSLTLQIRQKHEAMKAMTGEPRLPIPLMSVALLGPDSFVVMDGMYANEQGEFISRDGHIRWLRFGGRLKTRAT